MRYGLHLPQTGHLADPTLISAVATAGERAGYSSAWGIDRVLAPIQPRSKYPGSGKSGLPPEMKSVLDPIGVLTVAALSTAKIRLGTSGLGAPWYPAILLARSLTTLDIISKGRVTIGLGLGWSIDEYEACGVPMAGRGDRYEELIQVLTSAWSEDIVEVRGKHVNIA